MAITASRDLHIMSIERISFTGKDGTGVEYTEVLATDLDDGSIVVLRAGEAAKFAGMEVGVAYPCEVSDDGPASLRVRKYKLAANFGIGKK